MLQTNNLSAYLKSNWPEPIRKLGFKCKIINFSKEVIDYIQEDQIFIANQWKTKEENNVVENEREKRFPQLEQLIKDILEEYDEKVFIKLNWWAPKDCENWLLDLCCINMYDIFLALKSSALLMELIEDYKQDWLKDHSTQCSLITKSDQLHNGYQLEIRKWYKLNKQQEYRCFVYSNQLVGISQRNLSQIKTITQQQQDHVIDQIQSFYQAKIFNQFPFQNMVLDIYIDIPPKERAILVDINPWREFTRPKLLSWEQLEQNLNKEILFQFVQNEEMIIHEDYSSYRVPSEFLDTKNFEEIIKVAQQQSKGGE